MNESVEKAADDTPLKKTPQIIERIRTIMKYETAGDPMTGLKWTRKATRKVAAELQNQGIQVSDKSVARILKALGYSLQANRKKIALTGKGSLKKRKDRDQQFQHICRIRDRFSRRKDPIVSVDSKKKELIGNFKNQGRLWRNQPCEVADHDFPSYADAKICPYGIYDTTANKGSVYLGLSHDTAAFAVDSIDAWWKQFGKKRYPKAGRLLILADNGGSNSSSNSSWKYHLWKSIAQKYGLAVTVCHYPSGASKWNPVEHRLFSEISKNWAGVPLASIHTALNFIRNTKTKSGLRVSAKINEKNYPTKQVIPQKNLDNICIKTNSCFPKLNYTLYPSN